MTTESSADDTPAIEQTRPLRLPIALTLLLVNLFWLLISIEQFLVPRDIPDIAPDFADRARDSFPGFAGLTPLLLPLVAVLLVTHFRPVPEAARLVVTSALAQYAVAALFGGVAFFVAFFSDSTYTDAKGRTVVYSTWRSAVEDGFTRLGSLALLGVAFFVVYRIALPLFRGEPKPDRFAAYGRISQNYQSGPGQPPYGQPPAGYTQPATPQHPVSAPPHVRPPVSAPPHTQHQVPVPPPPHTQPQPVSTPPHASPPNASPSHAPPPDAEQQTQMLPPETQQRAEEARIRAIRERQQHWGQQP